MPRTRDRLLAMAGAGMLTAAALAAGAPAALAAGTHSAPRCGNRSLAVTRTYVDSGAGHSWMTLVYRNTTGHTCTVFGYPGLDAVTSKGHVLAHAKRTRAGYGGGGHLRTVKIRSHRYASASVEWLNFNGRTGGSCRFSNAIETTVANTGRAHRIGVSVSICGLQVHPTVAGIPQFPNYGPAQHAWIVGSTVDAAGTNAYLADAEQQLKTAKIYPGVVTMLARLQSFPDTGLSAKQITQVRADVRSLDLFFGTPGLYV